MEGSCIGIVLLDFIINGLNVLESTFNEGATLWRIGETHTDGFENIVWSQRTLKMKLEIEDGFGGGVTLIALSLTKMTGLYVILLFLMNSASW